MQVFLCKKISWYKCLFKKSWKVLRRNKEKFEKDVNFILASKKLFSFQLDKQNQKKISEKNIVSSGFPLYQKIDSIFFQNYVFGWSQKKYTEQIKINSKNFPNYKVKDLREIKFEENHKIHLGFVSGDFTDQHSIFYFLKILLNIWIEISLKYIYFHSIEVKIIK